MRQHVSPQDLEAFVERAFVACEVPSEHAGPAAAALCYADLVGMDTHGVANLERIYVPKLRARVIDPTATPRIERGGTAAATVDAGNALGLFVATRAVDEAVDLARQHGAGFVAVRRSSHFGSAGAYVVRAARGGFVALALTNCGLQKIAPHPAGGPPLLGTNPLAMAAPAGALPPFVLDMSTTVVPTGRVRLASVLGTPLPPGILADADGNPVTDPGEWERGAARLLWLGSAPETGAYKGFGLAILVDLLAGALAGAGVGPLGTGEGDLDVGHAFLVVDPGAFRPRAEFEAHAQALLQAILDAGGSYPGLREDETARRNGRDGIPISEETVASLRRVAEECGVDPPQFHTTQAASR